MSNKEDLLAAFMSRSGETAAKALANEMTKMNEKKFSGDDRYWYPEVDKAGNASATIRFLPAPNGESSPYVRYWYHSFKGPTGLWYFENCLTSLGQDDPCAQHVNTLYNSQKKDQIALGSQRKRKLVYVSNILVVKDPAKPENEGKVFLYRYGAKIMDKIKAHRLPSEDEPEKDRNPFDPLEGYNFYLKVSRNEHGFPNYDASNFSQKATPIAPTKEEALEIWLKCHSLAEILNPKNFKSYDQLKAQLEKVLGQVGMKSSAKDSSLDDEEEVPLKPSLDEEADDNDLETMALLKKINRD